MELYVEGTLPVAMTVLVGNDAVKCKKVELFDVTTGELFEARMKAKEGELILLHEFVAKVRLIDKDGNKHPITYAMLYGISSANFKKLEELEYELQAKLNAESLESQSN